MSKQWTGNAARICRFGPAFPLTLTLSLRERAEVAIELRRIMASTRRVARPERTLPQPGGLPDGSRGSARGARTPGTRERIVSTPEGCQNPHESAPNNDQFSLLLRKQCGGFLVGLEWFDDAEALSPLRGEIIVRGGPGVGAWRSDPRLPSGNPPGCEDLQCSCKKRTRALAPLIQR